MVRKEPPLGIQFREASISELSVGSSSKHLLVNKSSLNVQEAANKGKNESLWTVKCNRESVNLWIVFNFLWSILNQSPWKRSGSFELSKYILRVRMFIVFKQI